MEKKPFLERLLNILSQYTKYIEVIHIIFLIFNYFNILLMLIEKKSNHIFGRIRQNLYLLSIRKK